MSAGADPTWRIRRRATFAVLAACAVIVAVVMIRWDDTRLAETLALGAFGLAGAALGTYTGAAAYQDVRSPYGHGGRPVPYDQGPPFEDHHV